MFLLQYISNSGKITVSLSFSLYLISSILPKKSKKKSKSNLVSLSTVHIGAGYCQVVFFDDLIAVTLHLQLDACYLINLSEK